MLPLHYQQGVADLLKKKLTSARQARTELLYLLKAGGQYVYDPYVHRYYHRSGNIWVDRDAELHLEQDITLLSEYLTIERNNESYPYFDVLTEQMMKDIRYKFSTMCRLPFSYQRGFNPFIFEDHYELPLLDEVLLFYPYHEPRFRYREYEDSDFFTFCYQVRRSDVVPDDFTEFIDWLLQSNEQEIDIMIFSLGAMLLPMESRFNSLIYLYGDGKNGKSVLTKFFASLFNPEAVVSLNISTTDSKHGLASIIDRWFYNGDESRVSVKTDYTRLRQIADMSTVMIDPKYLQPFEARFYGRGIFNGNYKPTLRNAGDERRINFFNCRSKIRYAVPDLESSWDRSAVFFYLLNYLAEQDMDFSAYLHKMELHTKQEADSAGSSLEVFVRDYVEVVQVEYNPATGMRMYNHFNSSSSKLLHECYLLMCRHRSFNPQKIVGFGRYLNTVLHADSFTRVRIANEQRRVYRGVRVAITDDMKQWIYEHRWSNASYEELLTYELEEKRLRRMEQL